MKLFKRVLCFSVSLCFVFLLFCSNMTAKAASERILVDSYELDNGIRCDYYVEISDVLSRAYASSFTTYVTYTNEITGETICTIQLDASFTYDMPDGNARANSLSYTVKYRNNNYTLGGFYKTLTNGNPAKAQLTVNIYKNGTFIMTVYPTIKCNNNGSISYGR